MKLLGTSKSFAGTNTFRSSTGLGSIAFSSPKTTIRLLNKTCNPRRYSIRLRRTLRALQLHRKMDRPVPFLGAPCVTLLRQLRSSGRVGLVTHLLNRRLSRYGGCHEEVEVYRVTDRCDLEGRRSRSRTQRVDQRREAVAGEAHIPLAGGRRLRPFTSALQPADLLIRRINSYSAVGSAQCGLLVLG
jgi:hypothetical protein